jgi:hypothetical protein
MSVMDMLMKIFIEETTLSFTPIDQNQDYVVENCVNLF